MSFILYSQGLETGVSRSTSREAEGPALRSLGNLRKRVWCQTRTDVERRTKGER
jgi:hypothetical protein